MTIGAVPSLRTEIFVMPSKLQPPRKDPPSLTTQKADHPPDALLILLVLLVLVLVLVLRLPVVARPLLVLVVVMMTMMRMMMMMMTNLGQRPC